jgi:hypothetical protein
MPLPPALSGGHFILWVSANDDSCYSYKLMNDSQTVKMYRGYINCNSLLKKFRLWQVMEQKMEEIFVNKCFFCK